MAGKKEERSVGQVHNTSVQTPECQHGKEDRTGEHDTCKPDFDEKDSNISPRRKAPGPEKSSRNRAQDSDENPSQPARHQTEPKAPEAKIDDDLPPESEGGS